MSDDQLNALPKGYETHGYRIEEILGAGGFGITYKASETSIGRTVAVKEYLPSGVAVRDRHSAKVLPLSSDDRPTFEWGLDRFRSEAQTLVPFRHPNIVKVLRFFEDNGTAYMVMDYEDGESLERILNREGTLDETRIRGFLDPLLDGLAEIHGAGFLHRDIKPDNIYLRNDGQPVLLDFGAARQALGVKSHSLTAIVTSGYAPHEQYESDGHQGPWTDIYAMGAVVYAAMSGEVPPESTMRLSAFARGRDDPLKPVREIGAGQYSVALIDAVENALAILEHDRPQTVHEWQGWLAGEYVSVASESAKTVVTLDNYRSAAPRRSGGVLRIAGAVAVALVLSSGVASGGYYAYGALRDTYAEYERKIERERASALAARRETDALSRKRAAEAEMRRTAEEKQKREAEAEARRRAQAEARRMQAEVERAAKSKRQLEVERKRSKLARRQAEIERRRAAIESRKRASAEATRRIEESQRRRGMDAQRRAMAAERRKQIQARKKLVAELRKERRSRERAEAALRRMRESARKRAAAEARARREQQSRGKRKSRSSQRLDSRVRNAGRNEVAKNRTAKNRAAKNKVANLRRKPARRADIAGGGAGASLGNSSNRRRGDGARNPWRRRVAGPGVPRFAPVGIRRLLGRWCGPKGAIRFTRSHMIATRYRTGRTGRYQLAGYHIGPRSIVVQYLLPDGMHRLAFGRFSYDRRRMTEMGAKRPGSPWRRIGSPWHRC